MKTKINGTFEFEIKTPNDFSTDPKIYDKFIKRETERFLKSLEFYICHCDKYGETDNNAYFASKVKVEIK